MDDAALVDSLKQITRAAALEEFLKARYKTIKPNSKRRKTSSSPEPAPTDPVMEPASEPAPTEPAPTEPVMEPAMEPVTNPAMEPASEPATEPATKPAPTEPVMEPATKPAPTEPAPTEPAPTEPAPTEPATEPVREPAPKPVTARLLPPLRAFPITPAMDCVKADAKALEIVEKACAGENLKTLDVLFLLTNAEKLGLPWSMDPVQHPPIGSLFLFSKYHCPSYKRDGHAFHKESHSTLSVDGMHRIKVFYTALPEISLQRRSYHDILEPSMALVQYTTYTLPAKPTVVNAPPVETVRPPQQHIMSPETESALVAIGVRLALPSVNINDCVRAVNRVCTDSVLTATSLQRASEVLVGVIWTKVHAVAHGARWGASSTPSVYASVQKVRDVLCDDVMDELQGASTSDRIAMARVLNGVARVGILAVSDFAMNILDPKTPLDWASVYFECIRDALVSNDVEHAQKLVVQSLENLHNHHPGHPRNLVTKPT